ncbi:SAM-dependent methyltransferase [Campylobacter sp. MIT 21-1685]|uniref:SAM-dependent methyltransferase n=1 Tax=unclassified Campylobacter TaxID=2593542 RepID=UPI00224A796C|nr:MULTISPECIES: SAM-dependent methyltransferase [unclassified Campylobacter]MCX2682486.1 SAM-dependent methyltransferase [Campylobacter sp. MIT 21-1684]MCX2750801.1 SAM-dependent methyltransferase [Campylobacter sp. MIT 21-1682]MCX2806967.1 SAM-dependent methyltransferase [Campylobacter sp. MIT 21-1685]
MKFSQFFTSWLHKNYYKNAVNIGRKGDFFTTVSVGELFGTLLAKHFLHLIDKAILTPPLQIVEIGANEAYLSRDFLKALLEFRPEIFQYLDFFIIEPHKKLRTLQKKTLLGVEFHHRKSLQECQFSNAFFFCNELFDSFSVELIDNGTMAFVEDFHLSFKPLEQNLKQRCESLELFKGELSIELENFFAQLDKACQKFVFASFDYGVLKPYDFSLRLYHQHQVFNFFEVSLQQFFGKSDLTYNVNFTHLLKLIEEYNFTLLHFQKQNTALIDFGFEELINQYFNNKKHYENLLSQAKILFFNFDEKFHFFEFAKL